MGPNLTFLQDVQDAYAELTNVSMILVDGDGNEITEISNRNSLSNRLYQGWGTKEYYQEFLAPLKAIQQPTVVDNRMGLKLIVSPIKIHGQVERYLLAGYLLEPSSRALVREYMSKNFADNAGLLEALDEVAETSEEEKKNKLELIAKVTGVLETFLGSHMDKQFEQKTNLFIHETLEAIRTGKATIETFIEKLSSLHSEFDFLGLAVEKEEGYFAIESIHGSNTEPFKGVSFRMGEGFLGHTVAVQQVQFWKDTSNDPRVNIFHQHCLYPKSLFCLPLFDEEKVVGILFGGSTNQPLKNAAVEPIQKHSSLLSVIITSENLRENLQNHLLELSTFNEVFRVMTTVKDIKRVLYILVDISINIMRGPFACIVFKPAKNDSKVDIVSRGLSNTEISDYGYDVAKRTFSEKDKEPRPKQPSVVKTNWDNEVIEFPLSFNDQCFGVLCIGLTPKHAPEKYQAFLSSLAVAGSISIHLCQQEKGTGTDDSIIKLLQEAMSQQNQKQYQLTLEIKKHVEEFTSYLNDGNYPSVKKISGLAFFETELLENYLSDKELLSIFTGFKQILEKKEGNGRDSELLAMIYRYVTQDNQLTAVKEMSNVREELKEKFTEYVSQQMMVETVISLDFEAERPQVTSPSKPSVQEGENILKKKLNLSSREVEVLNQLLKGFSNREIASNLYISEHTVKNHITHIFQKLGVSDRAQAIAMIYQLGYSPTY